MTRLVEHVRRNEGQTVRVPKGSVAGDSGLGRMHACLRRSTNPQPRSLVTIYVRVFSSHPSGVRLVRGHPRDARRSFRRPGEKMPMEGIGAGRV